MNWKFFLIFITKNTNGDEILFIDFVNFSNFSWKFYVFNIIFLVKSLSVFVIFAGLQSAGYKYQTKINLKHSLSSIF